LKCEHCGHGLIKTDRREEMTELDDDATEGQIADFFAAELSGDYGAWGIGIIEYYCSRCDMTFEFISDELQSYNPLIIEWHKKAKLGDYFSRFVFEYLAFIANLKNHICISAKSDRHAIQHLKRDSAREIRYIKLVMDNKLLRDMWVSVIKELDSNPLHNTSHDLDFPAIDGWWNNIGDHIDKSNNSRKGVVISLSDWGNMVEFWYGVRNNLFHGGKDPNIQRDCFLVERAYRTLAAFMENEIMSIPSAYKGF
jgi:hypothetical protein